MVILNCLNKTVIIEDSYGSEVKRIPPFGVNPRLVQKAATKDDILSFVSADVNYLPTASENVYIIVTPLTKLALPERKDLIVPAFFYIDSSKNMHVKSFLSSPGAQFELKPLEGTEEVVSKSIPYNNLSDWSYDPSIHSICKKDFEHFKNFVLESFDGILSQAVWDDSESEWLVLDSIFTSLKTLTGFLASSDFALSSDKILKICSDICIQLLKFSDVSVGDDEL